MQKSALFFLAIALMSFVACSDDEMESSPSGLVYSYFPVNVGHEVIYDVVHITKDDFDGHSDTLVYQLKEVIESQFYDNEGRLTQRLERYIRNSSADAWVIKDVWTSNLAAQRAEKKEENITYIKLVFPISNSSEWNGNIMNTEDPQTYEYTDLHEPLEMGGISFDSTLTVLEAIENNPLGSKFELETYATGVGLIYREKNHIELATNPPPWDTIKSQDLYKETIVSWSN